MLDRGGDPTVRQLLSNLVFNPNDGTIRSHSGARATDRYNVSRIQSIAGTRADGYYGGATKAAVKNWQRKAKIAVDGLVGPKTWGAM